MAETLIEMAKELVLAQIKAQHVTPENLQTVLRNTYDAMYRLQAIEAEDHGAQDSGRSGNTSAPNAVDWKTSITKHAVTCLECGESFKQLSRRHLQRHGLDSRAYRRKYGIPTEQPLSSRVATARRRQLVKAIRPWEKAHAGRLKRVPASRTARAQRKQTSS